MIPIRQSTKIHQPTGNGWTLGVFSESGQFYATREIPIFERVFKFYANLIDIDHPNKFKTLKIKLAIIFVLKMTLLSVGHWLVQVQNTNTFCISTINSHLYTKTL